MSHFPKPFFKKARGLWYVEINRCQINLGPDRDAAFRQYHQLSPFHIEQWVDDFVLSQTSRRNYFRSIATCVRWAVRQGYIEKNPIAAIEMPSSERRDVYLAPEEFQNLLKFVPDKATAVLLEMTYQTGCRPQELLRVTAGHVDVENARWIFPQEEAKGKKAPRIVYLADNALAVTRQRMEEVPSGPLFRNSKGRPWTPDAMNCLFDRVQFRMGMVILKERGLAPTDQDVLEFSATLKKSCVRKGVETVKSTAELRTEARKKLLGRIARSLAPHHSLYTLRHSWATNALRKGVDTLTVAILMGHKDPSMLARVYQHLAHSPEHMLDQAKRAIG